MSAIVPGASMSSSSRSCAKWWTASNTKDEAGPDNDSEQRAGLRPPNYSNQCPIFSFRDMSESGNHVS